jgi:ribosomal protein S8
LRRIIGYPILYNVNNHLNNTHKNRALLVYLTKAFRLNENDPRFYGHQNLKQCKQIAQVLDEFGYIVDVGDIRDDNLKSPYNYDLVISHNYKLDLTRIKLKFNSIKIYLSTGINHFRSNINIKNRCSALEHRRAAN